MIKFEATDAWYEQAAKDEEGYIISTGVNMSKYAALQALIKECRYKTMRQVRPNKKNILMGSMLVIDPGSTSLGYAMYQHGSLITSGSIQVKSPFVQVRLKALAEELRQFPEVDLLVTEYIHSPNHKTIPTNYTSLLKSIGCIMSNTQWNYCLEIAPILWKDVLGDISIKGKNDEEDAKLIGEAMIRLANGEENNKKAGVA